MRAFLFSCLACAPLVVAYHFITRVPALAVLIVILNLGVGTTAGALFGWFANRRNQLVSAKKQLVGGILAGMVVTTAQYSVMADLMLFNYLGLFWGAFLGGAGAGLHLMLEKVGRGKEDASREDRFKQAIRERGDRSRVKDDDESARA